MSSDTATRRRADSELVRRGLVPSREAARAAIDAHLVTVDGAPVAKAATLVGAGQALVVRGPAHPYVSRGGTKLAHALDHFGIDVAGASVVDAGISTGGFTDCLLQRGASRVVGIDVGYGQVHDRVRSDDRVTLMERTHVRGVTPADLPWRPDMVVADLSFIALAPLLPGLLALAPGGSAVLLVKPQFEAGRGHVGRGGVVRDREGWAAALDAVVRAVAAAGWAVRGIVPSPIRGPAGNVEFLVHAEAATTSQLDVHAAIDAVLGEMDASAGAPGSGG